LQSAKAEFSENVLQSANVAILNLKKAQKCCFHEDFLQSANAAFSKNVLQRAEVTVLRTERKAHTPRVPDLKEKRIRRLT
jgi:hypothetical protein